ncbi:PACE efflux transporter [Vibrio sp. ER1A]|uniref:PACE efflux transporter n=1 Tax=Vibrio sp. ER1A TaxID=1517681 RepID=UPI0004DCDA17|nr:PACE efflux transporter [Vibrio sp. ER1A]KFA95866.1 transporter [Vibrio sp. ER1A]
MKKTGREFKDRLRHTIYFEFVLLTVATPILTLVSHTGFQAAALSAISLSIIAMVWNFIFNLLFDAFMVKKTGSVEKSQKDRVLNALLFESGLLALSLPVIAYTLQISILQAFIVDLGFVIFALVYSYIFNYTYDKIFPINTTLQYQRNKSSIV